jgi:hypothetical protein
VGMDVEGFIIYIECQSVCLFVGIGSPTPSPQPSVSSPLDPKMEGEHHSLACENKFRRLDKKPSTLWDGDWAKRRVNLFSPDKMPVCKATV